MKLNSRSQSLLAIVLTIALAATGCSSQWINIALQDLPVLTQMALNIATLASVLASGQQINSGDVAVTQNISAQASRDLNLLQALYAEYKANPSSTTLQKIQGVISDLDHSLPALLESAHISNSILTTRITAAVNLILTTVNSFAALIPRSSPAASSRLANTPPTAKQLKQQWNQQICATTGNKAFDTALIECAIR